MVFRLAITWILSPLFPLDVGSTTTYPCMLLAWSITGLFRNFQRTWRETHLIGGWQSNSLSLYISLVYLRSSQLLTPVAWTGVVTGQGGGVLHVVSVGCALRVLDFLERCSSCGNFVCSTYGSDGVCACCWYLSLPPSPLEKRNLW